MLSAAKRLAPSRWPWLGQLPVRWRRLIVWTVGLLLFYTLAGFFIAPPIVRAMAASQLSKQLNRKVSIAKVKLNPYAMSATIRGFLIEDKDRQPFVSWNEVYANFQFFSLFTRNFVFKEVRTSQPFARVQVNPDRTLNFSDILEKMAREAAAQPARAKSSSRRGLRIEKLAISGAQLTATDLTTKQPFTKVMGPLELTLQNFATHPDNKNPYSFTGSTRDGETFSWSGHFFLDPIRSVGEFALENISLARYRPLYQDLAQFDIYDGMMAFRSAYHVEHGAHTNLARLTNATISVRSLKLAEAGATNPAVEVPEFRIAGAQVDAFGRTAHIDSIQTRGGRLAVRRNQDASINLVELAKTSPSATNAPGSVVLLLQSVTNVIELLLRSTNAWSATLGEFLVEDYAVQLEDISLERPVNLDLDQINVRVRNVSNLPSSNLTAEVQMRWNTNGTIKTDATVCLSPLQAQVDLALDGLEVRALDPYLNPFVNLLIRQGHVGLQGQARLAASPTNPLPEASFRGDIWIKDFATVDGLVTEDFIAWKELRVTGLEASLNPLSATVQEVSLRDARARLAIDSPLTNNVFTVLRKTVAEVPGTNGPVGANPSPPPASARKVPKIQIPTNLIASAQATLPRIHLATVSFTNVHLDYLDRSVQPAVTLSIDQLGGTITGISTENLSRADVNVTGKVGRAAPMQVTGKINLLGTNDFTDVKVVFQGIELVPTSPYAGKFLGYRLNKGKLSLDVHYRLADGQLKGENQVTLDQLTLGDKVDSPDALKVPIKLALAILKDRSGRIELDVPVEGSLSDPEFKLSKVVTRALLNVVTKIVTSPFAALGGLFGGKGEEVSQQEFAAGSSELAPTNREKLDALVKGLYERPGLQLEIEAATDPIADRDALRRLKLQKQFRTEKWSALRKSEQSRLTVEQVELTPEEYQNYLLRAHALIAADPAPADRTAGTGLPATRTNNPARPPEGLPNKGTTSDGTAKGATLLRAERKPSSAAKPGTAPDAQHIEAQVLETIEVTETDFAMLAAERARRVKEYILQTGQVEADRVFVAEQPDDTKPAKGSRVVLHLR